jgi:hypothetical protein
MFITSRRTRAVAAGKKVVRPSAQDELLERIEGHIEEIRHNLIVEIKRLTQLQEQVDEMRLAVRAVKSISQ